MNNRELSEAKPPEYESSPHQASGGRECPKICNMLVSRLSDAILYITITEGIGLCPYPRLLPRSSLGELKVHIAMLSRASHAFTIENFYQILMH